MTLRMPYTIHNNRRAVANKSLRCILAILLWYFILNVNPIACQNSPPAIDPKCTFVPTVSGNEQSNDSEKQNIIDILKKYVRSYLKSDVQACADYIDDECSTYEEETNIITVGKDAVIQALQQKMNADRDKDAPLESYTINQPDAVINGDVAYVTFTAVKTIGGKNPQKFESRCVENFIKRNNIWKIMYYRSSWRRVN